MINDRNHFSYSAQIVARRRGTAYVVCHEHQHEEERQEDLRAVQDSTACAHGNR